MKLLCTKCGYENDAENFFCEACGSKLDRNNSVSMTSLAKGKELKNKDVRESRLSSIIRKVGFIDFSKLRKNKYATIAAAVLVVVVVGAFSITTNQKSEAYNKKISDAEDYYSKGNFSEAETAYLEAIDLNAHNKDAYAPLADLYISRKRYRDASSILADGVKNTKDKRLKDKKLEADKYVALIDFVDEEYSNTRPQLDTALNVGNVNSGTLSMVVDDFDHDSNPEMLVVEYNSLNQSLCFHLIRVNGNSGEEYGSATEYIGDDVLGAKKAVFIKSNGKNRYLCVKTHRSVSMDSYETLFSIYDLGNSLKLKEEMSYFGEVEYFSFRLNGEEIGSIDRSNYEVDYSDYVPYEDYFGMYEEADEEYEKECERMLKAYSDDCNSITQNCIDKVDGVLKKYGMRASSVEKDIFPKYNSKDNTQIGVCYVMLGYYDSDNTIDWERRNEVYLEDYTDMGDMLNRNKENQAAT